MNWNILQDLAQLEQIKTESEELPVLVFKHSTRCSISKTVLNRLERNWKQDELGMLKPYYLDLLEYRTLSTKIANDFAVEHESPQVIIVANKKPIYVKSHFDIDYLEIQKMIISVRSSQ